MPNVNSHHPHNLKLISATSDNEFAFSSFLKENHLIYTHLDWLPLKSWLGRQPFLLEMLDEEIQAALLTAPEVQSSTWIRLFGIRRNLPVKDLWDRLLSTTIEMLKALGITQLAALGIADWLVPILINSHFKHFGDIVVLKWVHRFPPKFFQVPKIEIRPMTEESLPGVFHVDQSAFHPLWQNSLEALTWAFQERGIKRIALLNEKIVGYQISTGVSGNAHLARLAVDPDFQGQKFGSALIQDLFNQLQYQGIRQVTVNTQSDNHTSLALYQKFGFRKSYHLIPVFLLDI